MKTKRRLDRRQFLKRTAQALATVAVCEGMNPATAHAATSERFTGAIPTRTLGKTGLKLPTLGYGGAALPKAWRNPLSHEDRVALVRYAYDRGIRYMPRLERREAQAIVGRTRPLLFWWPQFLSS
jgi:hypothetical protein